MKIKKTLALIFCTILLYGCNSQQKSQQEDLPKLNEWQKNLLEAEGLPTEYDQLTAKQQNTIDRVWTMISYLNEKYGEEFIYVDYIPQELNQSETLTAYPRSTGSGGGKYLVTVKNKNNVLTDDYSDFGVADLAANYVDDFLSEHFTSEQYRYFWTPNASDIKKSDIVNGDFYWKCGNTNIIFLNENACNMKNVEQFSAEYAKFLYDHHLDGVHRIQIIPEFPSDEQEWKKYTDLYDICSGFYCFHFYDTTDIEPKYIHTDFHVYNKNRTQQYEEHEWNVEDYFKLS
jgi:hypothetical protein